MTIFEWLQDSMIRLRDAGVDSPRRDCLVLLEDVLQKDRTWVLTNDHTLQGQPLQKLEMLLSRRINREPLAYIRAKAWFYGRFFEVNPSVLIPRPESEAFIELVKGLSFHHRSNSNKSVKGSTFHVIDLGTGSGCLAITAKLELPDAEVIAIDNDAEALKIAKSNAQKHNVSINFIEGSFLQPITSYQQPTAILVNLPYVPNGLITSPEIKHEPKQALFSGKDGLDHYRQFWRQIDQLGVKSTHILTESLENQHKAMKKLAQKAGYKLQKTEILVQVFEKQ